MKPQLKGRVDPARQVWGENEPWIRAMMMADEAEANGDAAAALDIMDAFATGPDGKPFWRPWRAKCLAQIAMLGPIRPGWVISRWICIQAMQSLAQGKRDASRRALQLAVELRGGVAALPGVDATDAQARITDHDWVYRQLFLYELGGLEHFVRDGASSVLLAGADSIRGWSSTPMGSFQLVDSTPSTVTWLELGTDRERTVPNIGSGCLVQVGEHAIGRIVPTEDGSMFEACPLIVSGEIARQIAGQPAEWIDILRRDRTSSIETDPGPASHPNTLLSDVPTVVWQLAILEGSRPTSSADEWALSCARTILDVAAREVADPIAGRPDGEVDRWSCLGAALLEPYVFGSLSEVVRPSDRATLEQLSLLLAEPAAAVCRDAAEELFDAA